MDRWNNVRAYFGDAFAFRAAAAVIPRFAEEGREFIDSMLSTPSDSLNTERARSPHSTTTLGSGLV